MLRFNRNYQQEARKAIQFQYILCYGSTIGVGSQLAELENFNTSYVTVQLKRTNKTI